MLFSKHQFISADLKWSNQVKYLILITLKGKLPFEWEVFNSLRRDLILQNEDFLIHQYLQNTFCPTYIHTPGLFAFHRKFNMNIHGQFHFFSSLSFASGVGFSVCRFHSFVFLPLLHSQQSHLVSIEHLQPKWLTDVRALLYFLIVISYCWKKN